ncbi:MAG TPA: flippase [Candidatus Dormibacteraeota bacterium]|nr:flippase [Candidatus Dormibacteraeota bacterium]
MSDQAEQAAGAAAELGTRAVSNALVILAARVVSRLVSLVVVIVLANALGATNYGRYTTLIAYLALVSVIADLGFNPLYTREAARNRKELGDYLGTLLVLKVALAAAASVILAIALSLGAGLSSLILPGAVLLIATAYANLLRNTFYAVGRAEFDAVAIIAEIAIQGGLIFYGARHNAGVSFYVWAYVASFLFTIVYSLVVIRVFRLGRVRLGFDVNLVRRWFPLALPFAFTFFLTNLYFRADVPILQHFRTFAEVGWYTFAYKPFEALQFIPLAIQVVVYPLLGVYFVTDVSRLKVAYERFFKVLVLLGWPLTVGTFVLVHPIIRVFSPSGAFAQSEAALRILAFAIVFLFANSAFYAMLNAINRQHLNAWATGLAAAINIVLNLIFIPLFGYLAASTTTVVTEAALCIFGWWFVQRNLPELRLPVIRLSWRVLVAGAVMGAVLYPLRRYSIFISLPAGGLVYLVAIFLIRAIEPEEWRLARDGLLSRLRRSRAA